MVINILDEGDTKKSRSLLSKNSMNKNSEMVEIFNVF